MDWKAEIGRRIKRERLRRDWTLEQLAEHTQNLSFSRIGNYEQGTRKPTRDAIVQLATALDVSPSYLECYTDDPSPASPGLSEDEKALLEKYRQTDERGRRAIHSVAESQPAYEAGSDNGEVNNHDKTG